MSTGASWWYWRYKKKQEISRWRECLASPVHNVTTDGSSDWLSLSLFCILELCHFYEIIRAIFSKYHYYRWHRSVVKYTRRSLHVQWPGQWEYPIESEYTDRTSSILIAMKFCRPALETDFKLFLFTLVSTDWEVMRSFLFAHRTHSVWNHIKWIKYCFTRNF